MESFKSVGRYLTLASCQIFLFFALAISGVRLWANVIMVQSGDAVRASYVAPFDRTMLFMASVVQMRKGNCKEAIKTLETVKKLYLHYWDAKNNLAICLASVGRLDDAKREWKEILEEWPFHKAARKNLREISKKGKR